MFHNTIPNLSVSAHRYRSLLDRAEERRRRLLQCYNEFLLAYEAGDMLEWIQEKKAENTGVELEDVWELQKKFDEFQTVRIGNLLLQMASDCDLASVYTTRSPKWFLNFTFAKYPSRAAESPMFQISLWV